MFKFFRRRPVIVERYIHRIERYPDPATAPAAQRANEYIERAESEYVRLATIVSENLNARDAGLYYDQETVNRHLGAMNAIHHSLAIIKGSDSIIEGAYLDRQAELRKDEKFPVTSLLAQTSPIYV